MGLNENNSPLSPSYFFSQFCKRVCSIFHFSTWKLGNSITFPSSSSHLQGIFLQLWAGSRFYLKTSSFLLWSERHWLWNIRSPINAFVLWELGGVRLPREFKPGLPWTVPWLNFELSFFLILFFYQLNQACLQQCHSSYLSQPSQPAVVSFFQAGVLFSTDNEQLWPILANLG